MVTNLPRDPGLPATYLQLLSEWLEEAGQDWRELFIMAGVDPECLQNHETRIPIVTVRSVIETAVSYTGEPGLGLELALRMQLPMHGALGRAVMGVPRLQDAIDLAQRYLQLRAPLTGMEVVTTRDRVELQFRPLVRLGPMHGLMLDAVILGVVMVGIQLMGQPLPDTRIHRQGREPAYVGRIRSRIPVSLVYGEDRDAISFPRHSYDAPLRFSDDVAARLSREQCERALQRLSKESPARERVRQVVETSYPFPPRLDRVSQLLFVSERTLKRRLQSEGMTYQAIVDEVRLDRARDLLVHTDLSLGQISETLGYADAANFTRAFRRWTGVNPSQYRAEARAQRAAVRPSHPAQTAGKRVEAVG